MKTTFEALGSDGVPSMWKAKVPFGLIRTATAPDGAISTPELVFSASRRCGEVTSTCTSLPAIFVIVTPPVRSPSGVPTVNDPAAWKKCAAIVVELSVCEELVVLT